MKYTLLGKTGLTVSRLGFGCMRLPMGADGKVDREVAIPMLRKAVDLGINYFDTAIFYCGGDSQRALGEAMEGRRDRVILSTKNHCYDATDDAWWARLEESLKFLRTDVIDLYNLHGMTWARWTEYVDTPTGKLRLLQRARDQGLIRHIGCSFHDSAESLVKLGRTGAFESVTIQYNLLDRSLEEAIHQLKSMNVGVTIMGPVGGGRLGVDSERIRELTGHRVASTAEAALRFVLAHPGVSIALSGMSSMEMLQENVQTVSEKEPFAADEVARIDAEIQQVREKRGVACTACGYCLPCPSGVDIPGNFGIYNRYTIYGLTQNAQKSYAGQTGKAVHCSECGACLPKCPQKIDIPHVLQKVVSDLDTDFQGWGILFSLTGFKEDRIRARVMVKNLTDHAIPPAVTLALADGAVGEPATWSLPGLVAGTSAVKNVLIHAPDGVGVLTGTIQARAGDEVRAGAIEAPFFIIPAAHWRWHQARTDAADFSGRQDIADAHGYRVGLRHDHEKIFLQLEIRSRRDGLAAPGTAKGGRIELYVDMRPKDQGFGCTPYGDGVDQLWISIGDPGHGAHSKKSYRLNQRNERTADGVRVHLELPFTDFLKPGWPIPKRIGLDFLFAVCDADGTELGAPTYGGQSRLNRYPGRFAPAILL